MGMHIDDAGHQREAASIKLAACAAGWSAYFGNAPILYRHVRRDRHIAAAVIDGGPANLQIKHATTLSQVTAHVPPAMSQHGRRRTGKLRPRDRRCRG